MMREDVKALMFAGLGGFSGGHGSFFGPSPLCEYRDDFHDLWPDVSLDTLDWNEPFGVEELIRGRKCAVLCHSFGVQRALHALNAADDVADEVHLIACDGVRYTAEDTVDVETEITSNPFVQKFDRQPMPMPESVVSCRYFIRKGGRDWTSYPQVSDLVQANGVIAEPKEIALQGFDQHSRVAVTPEVSQAWRLLCQYLFQVKPVLSL